MTRAKRSRDRGSTASSTPRWRWWPPSASAGTGGCCRAFATRAMGARTFIDWSVCCVSALVGSPSKLDMPAVLREHVPSMLGMGLLLAACGHDLTPAQPRAAKLAFLVEPTRTEGTVPIKPGPQVIILDQFGDFVPDATNTVTVALGANPSGATLTGTTDRKSTPVLVIMPAGVRFAAVSAGGDHTCGVTPSGTAYCWGWNHDGQLGDGTRVDRRTPVPVAAPAGVGFAAVSLGGWHTCGVTLGGTAYCWGHNAYGQLGDGTDTSRTIPVAVSVPAGLSFAAVSAGCYHTCGLA